MAQSGEGVPELLEAVARHRTWLSGSGELQRRRRARARSRVRDVVDREVRRVTWTRPGTASILEAGLDAIEQGAATPYSVAREILASVLKD